MTMGIVGFGRIGQKLAGMARGFGMEIAAFDPFIPADRWPEGVARATDLAAGSIYNDLRRPEIEVARVVFGE